LTRVQTYHFAVPTTAADFHESGHPLGERLLSITVANSNSATRTFTLQIVQGATVTDILSAQTVYGNETFAFPFPLFLLTKRTQATGENRYIGDVLRIVASGAGLFAHVFLEVLDA
jgi:hypothetical protein